MERRDEKMRNERGFTLIELLVVIVIIGILATLLMANYVGVRARARDTQRKSDLRQIQSALELYRSDVGTYLPSLPACGSSISSGGVTYMQKVPCDPTNSSPLVYQYQSAFSDSAYTLGACLENVNDQQRDSSNNPLQVDGGPTITTCSGGTLNWSYTLFSP
jgi:general secretion pathway protein G